jgi:hypothetical protein
VLRTGARARASSHKVELYRICPQGQGGAAGLAVRRGNKAEADPKQTCRYCQRMAAWRLMHDIEVSFPMSKSGHSGDRARVAVAPKCRSSGPIIQSHLLADRRSAYLRFNGSSRGGRPNFQRADLSCSNMAALRSTGTARSGTVQVVVSA